MTSAQNNNAKVKKIRGTDLIIDFRGEPLGSGSFGKVRRAYDLKNQSKKLCCKIFQINDESKLISAKNEFKIVAQLPYNPNLVSFEKIKFITRQEMYLFMEYCNGGDLQGYIKNNDYLSEYEIKDFLYQFIEGYTDLFKLNILHRDLKPENILIHNKKYKIADFGLSKLLEFEAQEVEAFGNIYFFNQNLQLTINNPFPRKYINISPRDISIKIQRPFIQRYQRLFQIIQMFKLIILLY